MEDDEERGKKGRLEGRRGLEKKKYISKRCLSPRKNKTK